MPRTPRERVDVGVYRDRYSLMARVQVGSGSRAKQVECAFPLNTPLDEIKSWREDTRDTLRSTSNTTTRLSFERDVERYLDTLSGSNALAVKSHLKAWSVEFGSKRRHQIRSRMVEDAVANWIDSGLSPKSVLNRCASLRQLYHVLGGGKHAWTPLDNLDVTALIERVRPAES